MSGPIPNVPFNAPAASAAAPATARPRGHNLRWVVIASISLVVVSNYLDRGNLSVAAPLIARDLGIGNTATGFILSAFIWPYALMNLPAGWMVDRFGTKLLLSVAIGLWSVVSVLTGFAASLAQFIGLRVCLGISEAPLFPSALKATNAWFPAHEKAAATSVYIAASQLGLAVSPPLATLLMVSFGWRTMFVLIGMIGFVALLGWIFIYREPDGHPWMSTPERAYIRAGRIETQTTPEPSACTGREWAAVFSHGQTWIIIVGAFCLQYVFWFYITWLPTYLQRAQHVSITHAGTLSGLPFIAGAFGVLAGGKWSDRLVHHGLTPLHARRGVIAGGGLLTACTMLATALSTGMATALALLTFGMFAYSLTSGCVWALASDVVETARFVASVGSIQNFGGFLGGACAPILTGLIIDLSGGFKVALLVTAALALVSAALYGLGLSRRMPI